MNQDSGGKPHVTVGELPDKSDRVEELWILVAIMPDGGEGIYGQTVEGMMLNFIAQDPGTKDAMESFLRESGSVEVCRRQDRTLEWRHVYLHPDTKEILT